MKLSHSFYAISLSFVLFACNNAAAPTEETTENSTEQTIDAKEVDISDMEEVDLSEFDLNATIRVANESNGKREISFTDAGNIQIIAGKRYGIEIVPFGFTVAEKKEEFAGDLVYEIEYIEESENTILYSKTIKDSEIEAEFHFFVSTEINGELVEIKNIEGVAFKKSMIEKMMASAKSIKPNAGA